VSPVFVDVGTKASSWMALRIVQGIDIATTTPSGIAAVISARRQPILATRAATSTAAMNHSENGRTRTETPSTAPNSTRRRGDGAPELQSCMTSTHSAAMHQNMNIVSSCRLPTWKTRFGNRAMTPAATRPATWPNSRLAMRYPKTMIAELTTTLRSCPARR